MSHRSSRRRAFCALASSLGLLALTAPTAPAAPAYGPFPVPADAPTVASVPSGAALVAWVAGEQTCVVFQDAGQPRPTRLYLHDEDAHEQNGICTPTPTLPEFDATVWWERGMGDHRYVAWGVGGPGTAHVEARVGTGVLASAAANAAPLPGAAADLRFWLLETQMQDDPPPSEMVLRDASGAIRRVLDPYGSGAFQLASSSVLDIGGTVLQHGRHGQVTWQLRRKTRPVLAPTPLEPDRHVEARCLMLLSRAPDGGTGSDDLGLCDRVYLDVLPMLATSSLTCGAGSYVMVIARPSIARVVTTLGDGTRRTVPLVAVGGAYQARAGALVVGFGTAIRSLTAYGADGRVVQRETRTQPPASDDSDGCGSDDAGSVSVADAWTVAPSGTLGAMPHVARAVDSGADLCVAVDHAPRIPEDCARPPAGPDEAQVVSLTAAAGKGRYVYGIVPTEVTAARVTLSDGATTTVPAEPIAGYGGRYAAVLRQVAYDAHGPALPKAVALLDARGRAVATRDLPYQPTVFGKVTTLAPAAHGLPALHVARLSGEIFNRTCVQLGAFGDPDDVVCDLTLSAEADDSGGLHVSALCAPRRIVVLTALRRRTDRLLVRTRGGRTITARTYRLPASAGPAAGRYVAMAVLGPHDAPVSVRVRGARTESVPARYPAAARQCGYEDRPSAPFETPRVD